MNHPQSSVRAAPPRLPAPRPAVLLLLLAHVTVVGCELGPTPTDAGPTDQTPGQTTTSSHTLAEAPSDTTEATSPQKERALRGELTPTSLFGGQYFRYDAFVLTALRSGTVTLSADVISVNPKGYVNGYGYPLSMASIEEGATFTFIGGEYLQDALDTGTAVITYPVMAGRQYVVTYKTFDGFTPQKYRLRFPPSMIRVEGRIDSLPAPIPVTGGDSGQISLENPRPATLSRIVEWMGSNVDS
ncbi:hypothetical protein [Cystobacter fuscus]|uniref:hypothetical protein n=1 Tax=Cystobacter fuscus TaxID=43 RepID=UPI002B2CE804|nr:hypothetical protein F0U63_20045 [Cystobacter fuscus]